MGRFREFQKLQNERLAEKVVGVRDHLPLPGELQYTFFVFADSKAVKQEAVLLAFEFAYRPVFYLCLFEIKTAFEGVRDF